MYPLSRFNKMECTTGMLSRPTTHVHCPMPSWFPIYEFIPSCTSLSRQYTGHPWACRSWNLHCFQHLLVEMACGKIQVVHWACGNAKVPHLGWPLATNKNQIHQTSGWWNEASWFEQLPYWFGYSTPQLLCDGELLQCPQMESLVQTWQIGKWTLRKWMRILFQSGITVQ